MLYLDCFSGASGDMVLGACSTRAAARRAEARAGQPRRRWLRHAERCAAESRQPRTQRQRDATFRACIRTTPMHHAHDAGLPRDTSHRIASTASPADPQVGASPVAPGRAPWTCSSGSPRPRPPSTRCRWTRSTCTKSVRSTRSSTSSAPCSRSMVRHRRCRVVAAQRRRRHRACAHGLFPVPAPATARLLAGVPIYSGAAGRTGHADRRAARPAYARSFGPVPAMSDRPHRLRRGHADFPGAERAARAASATRRGDRGRRRWRPRVVKIECEIDDMNPQLFGAVMDALSPPARSTSSTAVQMKKNRPGTLVTVVGPPIAGRRARSSFRETTTLGVRYHEMSTRRPATARS